MNKDQVEKRLEELQNQKKQMEYNLVAIDGAIQDTNYWLSQFEEKKEEKPSKEK